MEDGKRLWRHFLEYTTPLVEIASVTLPTAETPVNREATAEQISSPRHVWNARLALVITIILTVLTGFWWALQLASVFATPPVLCIGGNPFFSFAFTTVALLLLVLLLANLLPVSTANLATKRIEIKLPCVMMGVLLFLDVVVCVAVPKLNHQERWPGAVSAACKFRSERSRNENLGRSLPLYTANPENASGTLAISVWAVVVDWTVKWGSAEQEQRLVGGSQAWRTFGESSRSTSSIILVLILDVVVFLLTLNMVLIPVDTRPAAPGERYWLDQYKYQVHVSCCGIKTHKKEIESGTVIFEGGEVSGSG